MELHSLSNIWEARTVQHELAKHRVCWVAEGQNEFSVGRYGLGVLDSEIDKFLTDWSEARAGIRFMYHTNTFTFLRGHPPTLNP